MGGRGVMNIFDVYIAYVSWGSDGKRRPVLILEETVENVTALNITSKYESKSEAIRAGYFVINDWKTAGLNRQSYIDTNKAVNFPITAIDKNPLGRLSAEDEIRLIKFINQQ